MNRKDRKLLEKAALAAFQAFIKLEEQDLGESKAAILAWEAGWEFLQAKYDFAFDNIESDDLLRDVLECDGNTGEALDFMVNSYKDKDDPFLAYAEDNIGTKKTEGQKAILRWYKKQAEKKAVKQPKQSPQK
jgi:hypothetical protein